MDAEVLKKLRYLVHQGNKSDEEHNRNQLRLAEIIRAMSPEDATALIYNWDLWGRKKQFAPEGDWRIWLVLAGRGLSY